MKIEHFKCFKEIYFVFSWEVAIFSYVAHFQDNVFGFEYDQYVEYVEYDYSSHKLLNCVCTEQN